jgi:hypothetical protein
MYTTFRKWLYSHVKWLIVVILSYFFYHIGSEVLTAVTTKNIIFWDITLLSSLKVNRRFGGIYRLHIQGRGISQATNQLCLLPVSNWFLVWLNSSPWLWRRHVPPKRRLTFTRLHGIISQKIQVFMFFTVSYFKISDQLTNLVFKISLVRPKSSPLALK